MCTFPRYTTALYAFYAFVVRAKIRWYYYRDKSGSGGVDGNATNGHHLTGCKEFKQNIFGCKCSKCQSMEFLVNFFLHFSLSSFACKKAK